MELQGVNGSLRQPLREHTVDSEDFDDVAPPSPSRSGSRSQLQRPSRSPSASPTWAVADPEESVWAHRWKILKHNIPTVVSAVSVLTNVIILAALIPNMRSDIQFMRGQTDVLNSQVNNMELALFTLVDRINGANNDIAMFYGQLANIQSDFNATQTSIERFLSDSLAMEAHLTQTQAALNSTLSHMQWQGALAQIQVTIAETIVQLSLYQLMNATSASRLQLEAQGIASAQTITDAANNFNLTDLTGQLQQLQTLVTSVDSPHYVSNVSSDLGVVFLNGWSNALSVSPGAGGGGGGATGRPARFWIDRAGAGAVAGGGGVVHLEGTIAGGKAGSAAFKLPDGYHPPSMASPLDCRTFSAVSNSSLAIIKVFANGDVVVAAATTGSWTSLDGIVFATAT